ncbi:MAG TPA: DUF2950 domain-containing protein [Terriglobales bacterium]|nr:DUF2950 domain-containing protein [Terriglobales bacterium]
MRTQFTAATKLLVLFISALLASFALAQAPAPGVDTGQRTFSSAKDAADALFEAARAGDQGLIQVILGPDANDITSSGDQVADENARASFITKYSQKHALLAKAKGVQELRIGNDAWPFPIPIKEQSGRWRFDSAAGRDELLARRIGRNELATIRSCRAYVQAQREYAEQSRDGEPAGIYAAKLTSDPGKQNGLYWEVKEGESPSPMGPLMADATSEGYGQSKGERPFHGYFYRLLKAQGASAPGGAKNYLDDGKLKYGFALLAFPAEYGVSGIMTFIVSQQGRVYQRDLGKNTSQTAYQIQEYNPDKSWKLVQ